MFLKGQKALADLAARKEFHIALGTVVSTSPVMSAETTILLAVIAEVITAQTKQHLTSSGSQTAKPLLKSLSPILPGRYLTADQTIQNNIGQAGRARISVAEGEAASVTEVAFQGVALHLVEA